MHQHVIYVDLSLSEIIWMSIICQQIRQFSDVHTRFFSSGHNQFIYDTPLGITSVKYVQLVCQQKYADHIFIKLQKNIFNYPPYTRD